MGTGLGLSTVIGIVKSHGGFVDVSSEVGRTEFKVYLPAVEGTDETQQVEYELSIGQGELILVVDDETAICEVTKYRWKRIITRCWQPMMELRRSTVCPARMKSVLC
jgi:hypothetical protein